MGLGISISNPALSAKAVLFPNPVATVEAEGRALTRARAKKSVLSEYVRHATVRARKVALSAAIALDSGNISLGGAASPNVEGVKGSRQRKGRVLGI